MPWIACEWDAETDEVVVISEISHPKRDHAVHDCKAAANAAANDTPESLLWEAPTLPADSERDRHYATCTNGVIDLYEVKGTFVESGWVTSAVRDFTATKVSQYFPLKIPKKLLKTALPSIPEEEPFPSLVTASSTPITKEAQWSAVVRELKAELKRKRKTKNE